VLPGGEGDHVVGAAVSARASNGRNDHFPWRETVSPLLSAVKKLHTGSTTFSTFFARVALYPKSHQPLSFPEMATKAGALDAAFPHIPVQVLESLHPTAGSGTRLAKSG